MTKFKDLKTGDKIYRLVSLTELREYVLTTPFEQRVSGSKDYFCTFKSKIGEHTLRVGPSQVKNSKVEFRGTYLGWYSSKEEAMEVRKSNILFAKQKYEQEIERLEKELNSKRDHYSELEKELKEL